jgi:hypothetical protein
LGNGIDTSQLFKMMAGVVNSGRPVANLYVGDLISSSHILLFSWVHLSQFSMWGHDIVANSIGLASDLKMGQYLKVSVVSSKHWLTDRVPDRFLPVPCFYLKFGERSLVCPGINSVDVLVFDAVYRQGSL